MTYRHDNFPSILLQVTSTYCTRCTVRVQVRQVPEYVAPGNLWRSLPKKSTAVKFTLVLVQKIQNPQLLHAYEYVPFSYHVLQYNCTPYLPENIYPIYWSTLLVHLNEGLRIYPYYLSCAAIGTMYRICR